jgi:hypothetical protein
MSCLPLELESVRQATDRAESGPASWTLRSTFRVYRWRLLVTYALFNVENVAAVATPWALGCAIDGLLRSSSGGLVIFAAQQLLFLMLGTVRRTYDARVFAAIYSDLATRLVQEQRGRKVEVSRIAARSALSREVVSFFEKDVPFALQALYATAGGLVMLVFHDAMLLPLGLILMVPVCLVSRIYGRKTYFLNGRLNDELEREVDMIREESSLSIRAHFDRVGGWHIRLANWEALNFGLLDLCTVGLLGGTLARSCLSGPTDPARILMIFGYVQIFSSGLLSMPMLVRQLSRLRDICRRLA